MLDIKLLIRFLIMTVLTTVGCRLSNGYFLVIFVLVFASCAMMGKNGWALVGYCLLPVFLFLNSSIVGEGSRIHLIARVGSLIMPVAFLIQGLKSKSVVKLPIAWMVLYLTCATISSAFGWFPMISYLKIVSFFMFLMGLKIGIQNLKNDVYDLNIVRHGFLSIAVFLIIGSLLSYPLPGVGYSMEVANARLWGAIGTDDEIAKDLVARGGKLLFSGLVNHSQWLGPITAMLTVWTLCDMAFVVKRLMFVHMGILICAPVLLFMTRSRTALLSFCVGVIMVMFFAIPHIQIGVRLKNKLNSIFRVLLLILFVCAVFGEINSSVMSRWIFKTDDVNAMEGSISEIAETRMGLVELNMRDFFLSPLFGKGFQTMELHRDWYQEGKISILSAPIEKGVLPTMILGEGGIVGAAVFIAFLFSMYGYFTRKRYYVSATLFTVFLTCNMGEATFFSPGGTGGFFWLLSIAGGLSIDVMTGAKSALEGWGERQWFEYV